MKLFSTKGQTLTIVILVVLIVAALGFVVYHWRATTPNVPDDLPMSPLDNSTQTAPTQPPVPYAAPVQPSEPGN